MLYNWQQVSVKADVTAGCSYTYASKFFSFMCNVVHSPGKYMLQRLSSVSLDLAEIMVERKLYDQH